MNITHTISVVEAVWTLVAVVGLSYMIRLIQRSYQDREWLLTTEQANGDRALRMYVATTSFLIFIGGLGTQLAYVFAGIVAMTAPNRSGGTHLYWQSIVTATIFIVSSIAGAIMAGVIYHRRTAVVKLIVEHYTHKEREHEG